MVRIWVLSDVHLECYPEDRRHLPTPDCDLVVVAGDVWEGEPELMVDGLRRMAEGRPVVAVMGNHDLWDLDVEEAIQRAKRYAQGTEVHVLQDETIEVMGISFFGSTWWPDLNVPTESLSPLGEPIRSGGKALTQSAMDRLRARSIRAAEASGADVFVTHYGPETGLAVAPRLWVSGHYHSFDRRQADGTEFVRNPRQSRVFADRMVVSLEPRPVAGPGIR